MFALHETTQRRVCRGIFLVACVLPVLLTLAVVVYWNRPWRELDWQRSLAEQLHVRATLSEISTPRPGVTSLTNLNLADLRTGNPLGSIGTLTCQHENARLTLRADRLEIQADQLPALAVAVSTWLATSEPETLDLHVDSFTIVSPELNTLQLENLSISSNEDKGHPYFQLKALNTSGEAVQMTLECPGNSLRCVLDTGHASLPSWVLADWVPGASGYGNAKFSGVVSATHEDRQPRGLLRGQFSGVNLQEWIGTTVLRRLEGRANVRFDQLTWSDQRIETASGKIEANRGAATQSLLTALCKLFACQPARGWESLLTAQSENSEVMVPFDQLALGFRVSSAGIVLTGQCSEGALLVSETKPLLYSRKEAVNCPITHLVHLFHLPKRDWLPHTRSSLNMARELPLPGDEGLNAPTIKK